MAEMSSSESPPDAGTSADQLAYGMYLALQRGDSGAALAAAPAALDAAKGRPKLEARIYAWVAQARLHQADAAGAMAALTQGLRAARSAGDADGLAALRQLQAAAMAQAAVARPPAAPDTAVAWANARLDAGELEEGERMAELALDGAIAAGDHRERILALLTLARLPDRTEAALREAARVADDCGDFNLVTAVARAMKAANMALPEHTF